MIETLDNQERKDIPNQPLVRDLVAWLAKQPRSYDDVMAAWRTSCPRLPIWEDANDLGLVELFSQHNETMVRASKKGLAFLDRS